MHLAAHTNRAVVVPLAVRREPAPELHSAPGGAWVREVCEVARNRAGVGPGQGRRVRPVDQQLQRPRHQDGGGQPVQEEHVRVEKVQDIQHQG